MDWKTAACNLTVKICHVYELTQYFRYAINNIAIVNVGPQSHGNFQCQSSCIKHFYDKENIMNPRVGQNHMQM